MKRDMHKTVAEIKGKIPQAYNMGASEVFELGEKALRGDANAAFEAIVTAFDYGFALGLRCAKRNPGTKTGAR